MSRLPELAESEMEMSLVLVGGIASLVGGIYLGDKLASRGLNKPLAAFSGLCMAAAGVKLTGLAVAYRSPALQQECSEQYDYPPHRRMDI